MRCSTDIRKRVIVFVQGGGSKVEAARRFQVSQASVYRWLKPNGLEYQRPGPRQARKLDRAALRTHVKEHDDMTQKERARHFGVSRHCIWYALRQIKVSRKKTAGYVERDPIKRKRYLRLRERYVRRGKEFVYVDESGFAPSVSCRYGYGPKGTRVYSLIAGKKHPRTSLLAARIGQHFDEPFLFQGTCDGRIFNDWLERQLCPRLNENQVVVMDNVPFHKGIRTRQLIENTGATLLFLPPYSPDFNPIEHDFGTLKKIREYNTHKTLDDILKEYQ